MSDELTWVLCYDVTDDRRRTKLFKFLEGRGTRVQYSVFEVIGSRQAIDDLLRDALDRCLFDPEEDSLRCYALCDRCRSATSVRGRARPPVEPGKAVVL